MPLEQLFSLASLVALIGWLALLLVPRRALVPVRFAVPALLAMLYIWLLVSGRADGGGGDFNSLAGVRRLFTSDRALLAGWVHYLAFDLFVGTWITEDGLARGVPRLAMLPCQLLTFLLGPAGLLLWFGVRQMRRGPRREP